MKLLIKKIQMQASAHVPSYKVQSLKNKVSSGRVIVEETEQRFLHHVVAGDSYYGCDTDRFDAVTVEVDNAQTISICKESEFSVWFAKVLAFIRVKRVYATETECPSHNRENCTACDPD